MSKRSKIGQTYMCLSGFHDNAKSYGHNLYIKILASETFRVNSLVIFLKKKRHTQMLGGICLTPLARPRVKRNFLLLFQYCISLVVMNSSQSRYKFYLLSSRDATWTQMPFVGSTRSKNKLIPNSIAGLAISSVPPGEFE